MPTYPTSTIKSEATFRNDSEALFDPDTIGVIVSLPNGTTVTISYGGSETLLDDDIELTRVSLGLYRLVYNVSLRGLYTFVWNGQEATGEQITGVESIRVSSTNQGT